MSSPLMQAEHPANELRQELETYIVQKEHPSKSFITKKSIERCWPEDLVQLERKLGLSWGDSLVLSILAKECRVVTCILAWIKFEDFSDKLWDICQSIQSAKSGHGSAILKDAHLILEQDKCVNIFGFHAGHLFYQSQFMFRPILISSAVTGIHEVQPEERWPYASSPAEIGFGAYGKVYKVTIVKGQLQAAKDSSNDKEALIAFKRVERPAAWRKEVKTLDFLKGSLSGHKRLLLHIAAFIQGPDFLIFLPYTPYGDLETFLREGSWQDDNSEDSISYDFAKAFKSFNGPDLAREFAAVIDATGYLHERVSSAKGLPVYCAHVDLRTKNILVFPGGNENPAGIWHISDFGISSIKLEGGQPLPEPVWSKHPSMGDIVDGRWAPSGQHSTHKKLVGPHVAPEMSIHGIFMPKESDMWSLGCIFAEVLVFGLGTQQVGSRKKKLEQFRRERCSWIGSDRDDYFFDRKLATIPDTDEIQVAVSRRAKVNEWLTYLHNECGELYHNLTSTLDKMLQPDPRNRCTAKSASESVLTACKNFSKSGLQAGEARAEVRSLDADNWKFSAVRQTVETESTERLVFRYHLQLHDTNDASMTANQTHSKLETVDEEMLPDLEFLEPARSFSFQRSQTIEAVKGPNRIWPDAGPRKSKAVASGISSSHGVVVYLCQKQEASSPKPWFSSRKSSRKEWYEVQFCKETNSPGNSEAYPSYTLPTIAKWSELHVVGKHVFVSGPRLESTLQQQNLVYDFAAGAEIKLPEDQEVSNMHKLTSSGGEMLAAYNDKGFALWNSNQIIFKHNLSPKLGIKGQVAFSHGGSFLFTWSIYETDKLRIWSITPSAEPQVCASYNVLRPSGRARTEPLLVPCGSLPACIIRTKHGTCYTASTGMNALRQEDLKVVEQEDFGKLLPEKVALCTANERYFFYVCEKGCVCICDLVWDNDTRLRLVKRPEALAKSTLKSPSNMVLHAKGDEKYDLIISNREGAVESIEIAC